MTDKPTKLFVLDTNVLLHDHTCLTKFQENDVVIPITVLEELDRFKKGSDPINFQARQVIRKLDEICDGPLFTDGVPLGDKGGVLRILRSDARMGRVREAFAEDKADHRILALADELSQQRLDRKVVLISKDINLRMKAKSLGINSEDYESDKVANLEEFYTGRRQVESVDPSFISRFYSEPEGLPAADAPLDPPPVANEYIVFKNGSSSALSRFDAESGRFKRVTKTSAYGIEPRNAEQTFALDALLNPEIELLTITGKAGTGKTLLALAAALHQRRAYRQIFLARPIVPLGNRDLGFLPGDVQSKLDPYMQPLHDNLNVIKHRFGQESPDYKRIDEMLDEDKLSITPLAYIRGRSLEKIFFIVDEAQNLTPHEVKTIITRAGEGAKIVFTGDIFQIDTPYLDTLSNGLTYLVNRMKGQSLFAQVNLLKGERSPLAELASNLL